MGRATLTLSSPCLTTSRNTRTSNGRTSGRKPFVHSLKKRSSLMYVTLFQRRYTSDFCNIYSLFKLVGARCSSVVKSVRSWCDGSSDRSFMVDPLSYISFQPVIHDCCNKGCGMCYPVCGMMHVKEPLLLIGKSTPCGDSGFPLAI